ncbi:MAG TPA: DNA polymerase III subunit alpha [Gammaproteobacteria bacterium]|nr:DNA polymerase III subunit alpha [Gammaproteobacteria bacterium]
MNPGFVHLRLHTEYSLGDSVIRVAELMQAAAATGMPALALTDQGNLFALIKFYKEAQAAGIKPLVGADLRVRDGDNGETALITLLCCDHRGYLNLSSLITKSYLEGQARGQPLLEREWFTGHSGGLIALSGGREGDVGRALLAGREAEAHARLASWRVLFPERYYLELQRTGREQEAEYLEAAVRLAAATATPLVATNDVRFITPDEFEAHEARVCIQEGRVLDDPRRPRLYSEQQYLKSAAEMAELFADLPEALDNSVEIARRCNLTLELGKNFLPDFPVPDGHSIESFLKLEAERGLKERLEKILAKAGAQREARERQYRERLELELGVIAGMGFPGYFLIVADFIRWARSHGVPVGPGRGSGAGSLVAYSLGITDLDPIEHDLLFERFLNPERVSMPDFDVDFCMEGRDRVIDYVAERYGQTRVSQIITYGSMAARAVVRDVGRVLGHPYGYVDKIAKLIPMELEITLDKALEDVAELAGLYESDDDVHQLIDLAKRLEGLARNAGKHAGGVVIAPTELTDFTPLYCEAGGSHPVTQLDKDDVEAVGLVKFDFLGLRTLTIIDRAVATINRERAGRGDPPLDITAIPMDDTATYALLKQCRSTAVFQLESRGMRDLIRRLQPDRFEDIVALVALFRPGPLQSGMVDDFINRKHGKQKVDYPHPKLEPILKHTYGVILYQEQVMQIAQVLAGYTLGGADLLRRAMGKKKPEEMAKQRSIFTGGAIKNGVDGALATYIFDLMEKFAGYGFNKSHSAAYALLSYQTAWLKAHYPAAFMAAVLSSDMDHTDNVVIFIHECRQMELTILPPDLNHSDYRFTVADAETIRYGLGAIKGVGHAAIEGVLAERAANGPFKDVEDVCRRIDLQKVNKRVLEAMIRAGALDGLGANRATLMARLPEALALAQQQTRASEAGQNDMFGLAAPAAPGPVAAKPASLPDWEEDERLRGENETLGLYLTGHPINRYKRELDQVVSDSLGDLASESPPAQGSDGERTYSPPRNVTIAGLLLGIRKKAGRVILTFDDNTGRMEVVLFEDGFAKYRNLALKDRILVVEGGCAFDGFNNTWRISKVRDMYDMDALRERRVSRLDIVWDAKNAPADFVPRLKELLKPHLGGQAMVRVQYHGPEASQPILLGDGWRVHPAEGLTRKLEAWLGADKVAVHYAARAAARPAEAVGA